MEPGDGVQTGAFLQPTQIECAFFQGTGCNVTGLGIPGTDNIFTTNEGLMKGVYQEQ